MRGPFHTFATTCALALGVVACDRTETSPPAPVSAAPASVPALDLARDDRIAHLMGGCAKNEPFLEDTSDPIGILVSKLAAGQIDPLRAAREELVAYDERALPELRRLFDACYGEQFLGQRVQNVVEVVGLMPTDAGRPMILLGLAHPQETVRKASARALVRHARPEDFEKVLDLMALSGPESQGDFALALLACDRPRLERQFADWLAEGQAKSLVDLLAVHVCDTHDPGTIARLRTLLPKLEGKVRVFVQAAIAAQPDDATHPDDAALAELRTWLFDASRAARRQLVAQALARVGLARELEPLLTKSDPDEALRKAAVQAIAELPIGSETRSVLRSALTDRSDEVRDIALAALTAAGDAGAIDAALEMLTGSRTQLEAGLKALRVPMETDAKLAERVLGMLTQIHAGELGSGSVDVRTIERSIGQLPLPAAAEFVMKLSERGEGPIQGARAHRWYAQTAGNTGSAGLAFLRERWKTEADPLRRMDLVMAGTYERSDAVREFLTAVVESPRCTPPETLYAADRLANLGPMEVVAPILKRVGLSMRDKDVRPAFNCLLWNWYGRSK